MLAILAAALLSSLVDPPVGPAVDPAIAPAPSGIPTVDFAREIAPILESKCLPCHGPEKQRSGYRVDVRAIALEGGEYSAPNIVPGNAAKSPLYLYVSGGDPEMEMPPKGEPLNPAEIDLIKRWIDEGANWPEAVSAKVADPRDWWSLQPIVRTSAQPSLKDDATHSIDGFIRARLRDAGLKPAPEADVRTQLSAPEAVNLKAEPAHVLRLYGLDRSPSTWDNNINDINDAEESYIFAEKCLTARRLLERGVRFVQVWSGNDNSHPRRNWDSHEDIRRDHGPLSRGMARGAAALIADLKQRGMLEDTLVIWTTEFGRMPSSQGGKGRDHNPFVYTNWMCGAGVKGGVTYGESDRWGYKPLDRKNPTTVYDIHATMLHLLGIDHTKLTWRHNGADRRLTDVHGHVISPILA
jgi:mono/diheme cytochrome c family protein